MLEQLNPICKKECRPLSHIIYKIDQMIKELHSGNLYDPGVGNGLDMAYNTSKQRKK